VYIPKKRNYSQKVEKAKGIYQLSSAHIPAVYITPEQKAKKYQEDKNMPEVGKVPGGREISKKGAE